MTEAPAALIGGIAQLVPNRLPAPNTAALLPSQAQCVLNERVLGGSNLVFCTPTSAGKSLVAELLISRAFQRRKKALLVLPFVSMVEESTTRLAATFRQLMSSAAGKKRGPPHKISVQARCRPFRTLHAPLARLQQR